VLTPRAYAAWLTEHAVAYVALPDAKLDYSAKPERRLIKHVKYLKLDWRSRHWRVYRVTLPHPTVIQSGAADIRLERLMVNQVALNVVRPGAATVRVRWSPYWSVTGGCVERDGEWTRVLARRPGALHMRMSFAFDRVLSHGRRCG
jgi:hypothetical protein